jgi:hypothetical protein
MYLNKWIYHYYFFISFFNKSNLVNDFEMSGQVLYRIVPGKMSGDKNQDRATNSK